MSNIKQNYFTGKEKKQENLSKQERCCKCVLSYYGKRAEIFEVTWFYFVLYLFCANYLDTVHAHRMLLQ